MSKLSKIFVGITICISVLFVARYVARYLLYKGLTTPPEKVLTDQSVNSKSLTFELDAIFEENKIYSDADFLDKPYIVFFWADWLPDNSDVSIIKYIEKRLKRQAS